MRGCFMTSIKVGGYALRNALNSGVLPADYYALVEQNINGPNFLRTS